MISKLCSLLLVVAMAVMPSVARAQELNCKVTIQRAAIRGVDPEVFKTMERSVTEFMNTRKWTNDEYGPQEKIDVNVMLNLTDRSKDDVFTGTLTLNASRPVYNASYTSPTVNFVDKDVAFRYSQFTPLTFDDNRVAGSDALSSNLTAILAYYSYIILGLDYDSFAPNGGDPYFKKAQAVCANAPESGSGISGWKPSEGNRNRYWIVDQILSPRFTAFRTYWYSMHREGLDNMYAKPEIGRQKILAGIPALSQLQKENPGAILIQFFFNAKSDEIAKVLAQVPREERGTYITQLMQMDVANLRKYEALR
jgi:hypothetical protein